MVDLLLGVFIIGGVTAVITVFALVLARREDREAEEARRSAAVPPVHTMRRAS